MPQLIVTKNILAQKILISLAFLICLPFAGADCAAQTAAPSPSPSTTTESAECTQAKANVTRLETRLRDWPALARYREENSKTAAPDKKEKGVGFLGDSITDGWPNPANGGFFSCNAFFPPGFRRPSTAAMG